MAPQCLQGGVFAAFSDYPVTRRFSNSNTSPIILILTILTFGGLAVWNILTQGFIKTSESVLLSRYTKTDNTTCQPAAVSVGQSLFTVAAPNAPEGSNQDRGGFQWVVGSVVNTPGGDDSVATGFLYNGGGLHCNITSVGLTYRYTEQSYLYGVCALCEAPIPNSTTTMNYIRICSDFDLATANLPTFTQGNQQPIQDRIFIFGGWFQRVGGPSFYQMYNFAASSLPAAVFPPYNIDPNPLTTSVITPKDAVQVSFWLNGISYTVNTSATHTFNEPNGTVYVNADPSGAPYANLSTAFLATSAPQWTYTANAVSGMQLAIAGIGGLQPLRTPGAPGGMAAPFPDLYTYAMTTLAVIMDRAGADTDGRSLGAVYLCTVTGREWKHWLELVALVIGNSVGVVAAALTAMIALAKTYDSGADANDERETLVKLPSRNFDTTSSFGTPVPYSSPEAPRKFSAKYSDTSPSVSPETQRAARYPSYGGSEIGYEGWEGRRGYGRVGQHD